MKLSTLDTFTLGMVIDGAWIYDKAPDVEKMREALAYLERTYPFLAGHYDAKTKSIHFSEDSRGILKLESLDLKKYTKAQLICDRKKAWSLVKALDMKGFRKGSCHGFSATLATLSDGAILYVQTAHALMDGNGFHHFMRQWAALYRGESIVPMTADRTPLPSEEAYTKEETLQKVIEQEWQPVPFKKLVRMIWSMVRDNTIRRSHSIEVSQEEIERLKSLSGAGTHAVLSAITARIIMDHNPSVKSIKLLSVADLRGRFSGISEDFMGNLSQPVMASGSYRSDMDTAGMARQMDTDFKSVLNSGLPEQTVRLSACASHYGLPYFYFDASEMNCRKPGILYVNNQLKFRPAELDWGDGPAVYAFPNGLGDMVKFWQPVPSGPIQIIFSGITAKITSKPSNQNHLNS